MYRHYHRQQTRRIESYWSVLLCFSLWYMHRFCSLFFRQEIRKQYVIIACALFFLFRYWWLLFFSFVFCLLFFVNWGRWWWCIHLSTLHFFPKNYFIYNFTLFGFFCYNIKLCVFDFFLSVTFFFLYFAQKKIKRKNMEKLMINQVLFQISERTIIITIIRIESY